MRASIITDETMLRRVSEPVVFDSKTRFMAARVTQEAVGRLGADGNGGLAAPQIGMLNQLFYWRFAKSYQSRGTAPLSGIACNPTVVDQSDDTSADWERCLSSPDFIVLAERPNVITVEWATPKGVWHTTTLSGICARLWSHEIDHLNGVLSIDHQPPGQEPVKIGTSEQQLAQSQAFLNGRG